MEHSSRTCTESHTENCIRKKEKRKCFGDGSVTRRLQERTWDAVETRCPSHVHNAVDLLALHPHIPVLLASRGGGASEAPRRLPRVLSSRSCECGVILGELPEFMALVNRVCETESRQHSGSETTLELRARTSRPDPGRRGPLGNQGAAK